MPGVKVIAKWIEFVPVTCAHGRKSKLSKLNREKMLSLDAIYVKLPLMPNLLPILTINNWSIWYMFWVAMERLNLNQIKLVDIMSR